MSDVRGDPDPIASGRLLAITATIVVAVCVGSVLLFAGVWHRQVFEELPSQPYGVLGALIFFVFGAAFHELVHAFGWKTVARVPWATISPRRSRRKLGIIAQINVPVPASAYRVGVALPALVLGVLPMLVGLASGSGLVVLWGAIFFFECFSDIAILLAIRHVPRATLLADHAERLGCRIIRDAEAA